MDSPLPSSSQSSPSTSNSASSILILNDDCLISLFKYLNLDDLCAVADVCSRFRRNAQTHFSYSKLKELYSISYCICRAADNVKRAENVLSIFGNFVKSIKLEVLHHHCDIPRGHHKRVAQMLRRHCCETLHELVVERYFINDEIALLIHPALANLRTFSMIECTVAKSFVKLLPKWSPKLRELRIVDSNRIKNIGTPNEGQPIPLTYDKLETLYMERITDVVYVDLVEDVLKSSPLLKKIEVVTCQNKGNRICSSIVKYAPQIENLRFHGGCARHELYPSYFGRLTKLQSLAMTFYTDVKSNIHHHIEHVLTVLNDIIVGDIPLENLELNGFQLHDKGDRFADEISKLKKLKTLRLLNLDNLTPSQFLHICRGLSELTEIYVSKPMRKGKCDFSPANLLTLVKNGKNLQILSYDGILSKEKAEVCINDNTYTTLLNILQRRTDKKHLKIILNRYTKKMLAPDELMRTHNDLMSIEGMPPTPMQKNKRKFTVPSGGEETETDNEPPRKKIFL